MLEDHLNELRVRFEEIGDLEWNADFVNAGCDLMISLEKSAAARPSRCNAHQAHEGIWVVFLFLRTILPLLGGAVVCHDNCRADSKIRY